MQVVAEGVENDAQRRTLIGLNCWAQQGYYFARPMSAEAFTDWFRNPQQTTAH